MSSAKPFSTVTYQDGSVAVVHADPRTPRSLEVIAIFFDTFAEPTPAPIEAPARPTGELPAAAAELTARQSAVLAALCAKMDADKQVEAKAAVLAEAANIPLGSLHSVLQSLRRKQLIKTVRAGSARAPAAYRVL